MQRTTAVRIRGVRIRGLQVRSARLWDLPRVRRTAAGRIGIAPVESLLGRECSAERVRLRGEGCRPHETIREAMVLRAVDAGGIAEDGDVDACPY